MLRTRKIKTKDIKKLMDMEMRPADVAEVKAHTAGALTANEALIQSIGLSYWTVLAVNGDDDPVGVAGIVNQLEFVYHKPLLVGRPWCLGTEELVANPIEFYKLGKRLLKDVLLHYDVLSNHVSAENTLAVRWLKHMGFLMLGKEDYYANGTLFKHFEIYKERSIF